MNSSSTETINFADFSKLIGAIEQPNLDNQTLLSLIDYTFLDSEKEPEGLPAFVESAYQNQQVAGICVYAHHLYLFKKHPSKKITVVNFPTGDQSDISVFGQFDAINSVTKPDEIDYVFPYRSYLNGEQDKALQQCKKIINDCRRLQISIKIIIESGELGSPSDIYQLCRSILGFNPDFIKTSTGFSQKGASFEAATAICQAIKDAGSDCGIKVSGGIRDALTACRYIHIAENILERTVESLWFRIGASQLVQAIPVRN